MPLYPAVSIVKPLTDYRLLLTFDNREERIFDVTPWLAKGAFRELADEKMFRTVRVSFDTVEWANGSDLCPELLYEESIPAESQTRSAMAVAEERARYTVRSAGKRRHRAS